MVIQLCKSKQKIVEDNNVQKFYLFQYGAALKAKLEMTSMFASKKKPDGG